MKYQGVVSRVSKFGIQLQDSGEKWYNWAHEYEPGRVEKGESVSFETNEKGYVTALQEGSPGAPESSPGRSSETNRLIVRQVCVKAAVEFLNGLGPDGPPSSTVDVLAAAQDFEDWVMRDAER